MLRSLWSHYLMIAVATAQGTRNLELEACVAGVFGNSSSLRVVTPNDATYTDARIGESIQFKQFPTLIAYAEKASEIAPLIACAKATGVEAVPRSGGHHFVAWSAPTGALVIDIGHISQVAVSLDKTTAVVGAGIRLGPLYTALGLHGRDFPGGICPSVGLSGFLGAGGFNMQMRQLGLAVDSVLAAKVVLADGRTVTATSCENEDLFWAIRGGGGGTFGIVVEWTLKLHEYPRSAMLLLRWNEPHTRVDVATRFFEWAPYTDPAFTSQVDVHQNRTQVLGWCFGCDVEHLQALVADSGLLGIGNPEVHLTGGCSSANSRLVSFFTDECISDEDVAPLASLGLNHPPEAFSQVANYTQFRYKEVTQDPSSQAALPWARWVRISKSYFLQNHKPASRETIQAAVDKLDELPEESGAWGEWHAWNIKREGDSAFAWADKVYGHWEFIVTGSLDENIQQSYHQWEYELEGILRPKLGPASYTGYMDVRISSDPLESYFGSNVDRLAEIKRVYDPDNFFHQPFSVTPDSTSRTLVRSR